MKIKAIAAALIMSFMLSGCSFIGFDAQTLMHPPRPTGEKADIHTLLVKKGGEDITLKYPQNGDYRSAIITHDLCGDYNEEALAIYQKGDESSGTNIMFMKKDGKWQDMGMYNNSAAQVDKVCFGDLNGDNKDEVIVGWGSSLNNTSTISVYYYKNGKMNELKTEQGYTELAVMDFDGDKMHEIFTANVSVGEKPASAQLFRAKQDHLEMMDSCPLDSGVTKYASVQTGLINEKQTGIILDGMKSADTLVTELIYWDNNEKSLKSPFFDLYTKSADYTKRNTSVVSKDINGDKIIEFPIVNLMPGYNEKVTDDSAYVTNWNRYDTRSNTFVRAMSMVLNYSDGYWFLIPDIWRGKVTTKTDTTKRMITFYEWVSSDKNPNGAIGAALLKIQVFSDVEWENGKGTTGFYKLLDSDNMVFAANSPSPNNSLSLNSGDVKNSFKLISHE
jgi:hypothetical protein